MSSKARGLADLGNAFDDGALSNRNLIINGAMQVAQRETSVTGVTSGGYYTCDRWLANIQNGTWTISQEADAPEGFSKSIKYLCTATGAAQVVQHTQVIEGANTQQLAYGTSSAKDITVSFWVKANVTGTYSFRLYNPQGTPRLISQNYTINSSGVWEYKTITLAGDTVRDIADGNGIGINVAWWLSASSTFTTGSYSTVWQNYASANEAPNQVDVAAAVNNYWQITGVQLEVGDGPATPFEHRFYGDELARCQRYYFRHPASSNTSQFMAQGLANAGGIQAMVQFPVVMRAIPTAKATVTNPYWESSPWTLVGSTMTITSISSGHLSPAGGDFAIFQNNSVVRGTNYNIGSRDFEFDAEL
tara:strand:- start:415 stop:1497 length:1083 start_codon:yes stop_codon:yes gene_type:complete